MKLSPMSRDEDQPCCEEDEQYAGTQITLFNLQKSKLKPIPVYGVIDHEKLDNWLDQLEV